MLTYRIINEISRNMSGYLHVPGPLLKDVGFIVFSEIHNKVLERFGYCLSFSFI